MDKKFFIIINLILGFILFSQNFTKENIYGHFQWVDNRETKVAINKNYTLYKNIVLFKNGTFVMYDTLVNTENNLDVKYNPEMAGTYEVYNNLLFLISDNKLYIFKIESATRIKGSVSDYIYNKVSEK